MKGKILIFPILFSMFAWIASLISSSLFFSQLPLLETIFLPRILFGAIFLFIVTLAISILVYKIKETTCFNIIPLIILQLDREGKIVFINDYLKEVIRDMKVDTTKANDIFGLKHYVHKEEKFSQLFKNLLKNPEAYVKFSDTFSTVHGDHFKITIAKVDKKITLIGTNETYHKNLENEISKKDLLYKNLINAIPLPIGFRNIDGSLRFGNNCFVNMIKKTPEDNPEKQKKYKNNLNEVVKNKESRSFHLKVDNKIFEVNQTPFIKDEELDGVICFGIDKTKDFIHKKQAEERIKYQDALYKIQRLFLKLDNENFNEYIQLILKEINSYIQSDVIYFYEINGNKRVDFYEYKKSYSPSFVDKIKEVKPNIYPEFMKRFENGDEFITDNSFKLKTTTDKFFASLKVVSLLEKSLYGKKFKGMLGACNFTKTYKWNKLEISYMKIVGETLLNTIERILIEKELYESEETFNILTENSPLGVVVFDINQRTDNIHYINKEAEECLGYTKEKLNKMKIEDFISDEFKQTFQELLDNRKKDNNRSIIKIKRKEDEITVDASLKEIKIKDDSFSKYILVSMVNLSKAMHISNKYD